MGYCHCTSCRSYSGAPVSAYLLWTSDRVRVVRARMSWAGSTGRG
ncbi:GFA family protein [Elioraea sp.]